MSPLRTRGGSPMLVGTITIRRTCVMRAPPCTVARRNSRRRDHLPHFGAASASWCYELARGVERVERLTPVHHPRGACRRH
jgi:hypothetical protein